MEAVKIKLTDEELEQINGGFTVERIIPLNGKDIMLWIDWDKRPDSGKDEPGHNEDILPKRP